MNPLIRIRVGIFPAMIRGGDTDISMEQNEKRAQQLFTEFVAIHHRQYVCVIKRVVLILTGLIPDKATSPVFTAIIWFMSNTRKPFDVSAT